ncbi:MAG: PadR family transcriptional regulator [Acetobacter sp.]|nr:PadR family transcriptional regulator [Bacteroides sp.]MCM1341508.1 PadR family transcriptional regulator [Acetobacter sp.]MCM1433704.1 PadR family transcriptional regulator [Clostridiales bacterium]
MRYSKELLKGSTPILVMSVLKGQDLYGYKIIRELEIRSENVFEMSEGTLYPILHALEKEKFLVSYWEEVDGRRRKYYHLTDKGAKQFEEKKEEFISYSKSVTKVLSFA